MTVVKSVFFTGAFLLLCGTTSNVAFADSSVITKAESYVGMHERKNRGAIKEVTKIDPARIPWCAAFVNGILRQLGLSGIGTALQGMQTGIQGSQAGMQGAQVGLQGVDRQLAGTAQGMQGAQTGLQGVNTQLAGTAQGMQGAQVGLQGVSGAQAGYGLANQAAGTLGSLGTQQNQAQMGILGLQNQIGQQQQAQEQLCMLKVC